MRNLQLGIIFSIARSTKEASDGVYDGPAKEEEFAQQVCCPFTIECTLCWSPACCLEHNP